MKHTSSILLFVTLLALAGPLYSQQLPPVQQLTAEVNYNGHVVLRWVIPSGYFPSNFDIKRGYDTPDITIGQIYDGTSVQFTDYTAQAGKSYEYAVVAHYSAGKRATAYTSVTVLPPASGLQFTSIPRSTALANNEYFYTPTFNQSDVSNISLMLIGEVPEGMTVHNIALGPSYLYWVPKQVGRYKVTLQATDMKSGARAVQEFDLTVVDQPGTIRGFVKALNNDPIPNTIVRFWTVSQGRNLLSETRTDENGEFVLENVQAGRIYAYAEPPDGRYLPQFYINANSLSSALERSLLPNRELRYEFYLFSAPGTIAPVVGRVRDEFEVALRDAKVTFIRKEDFIHIGDTTRVNALWQENSNNWRESIVDTVVYTDFKGEFLAYLPVGRDYYTIVEKDEFLRAFNDDQTNAMQARAVRIANGITMSYTLSPVSTTNNKLVGQVYSQASGVSKQATIILIDTELKRGTGGGHTYRKYRSVVTDTNGVFIFDNLPEAPPSALLAIPMDSRLAPQYYHSSGGSYNFRESDNITPLGTKNYDFVLPSTQRSGIGSFYGQVTVKRGGSRSPLAGALIFAQRERTGAIAGYAITDSTGWYSITGLDPDQYLVFADHPEYTFSEYFSPAKPSISMPATMTYISSADFNRTVPVNFTIEDLRVTPVDNTPLPFTATLEQNHPNPFHPSTAIRFALPARTHVTLQVYNALGELVATLVDETMDAGSYSKVFDGNNLPSGVYHYRLSAGGSFLGRSMMLTR